MRVRSLVHPLPWTLSRYVDNGLSSARQDRIQMHVDRCARCQKQVASICDLSHAVRLRVLPVPPDVADQVLQRRRAGERVLLSTTGVAVSRDHRLAAAAVAAGLLFVSVASIYLLSPPAASATRGELAFSQLMPTANSEIGVTYSPAFYLAGEDSLRLRARVRNADSQFPRKGLIGDLREVTLRRKPDGTFEGHLQLEESDVYVAAAVEDFHAINVDANFGELWELMIAATNTEPSVATLEGRYRILEPYNWIMASAWAGRLTTRYPDNPFGWALKYANESMTGLTASSDSLIGFHRDKLRFLIDRQGQRRVDVGEISWLATYARWVEYPALQDSLVDVIRDLDPNHKAVVDRRILRAIDEYAGNSEDLLHRLDQIWSTSDGSNELLSPYAASAAARENNLRLVRLWIGRARQVPGISSRHLLEIMEPFKELAPDRIQILGGLLGEMEALAEEDRPLRAPTAEYESDVRIAALELKVQLARALADSGDVKEALSIYSELADQLWRPETVRPYVDLLLTTGDTASALPSIGLLNADPINGTVSVEDYSSVISSFGLDSQDYVQLSHAEFAQRIFSSLAPSRPLPGHTPLNLLDERSTEAHEYLSDRPTVFLMWHGKIGGERALLEFESLAHASWAADRIRSIVVANNIDEPDRQILALATLPIVHDIGYELTQGLRVFSVPTYVVVDEYLNVLADTPDGETAFRIASVLAEE